MIGVIQNMHRNFISHHWIKSYGEKYTEKLVVCAGLATNDALDPTATH